MIILFVEFYGELNFENIYMARNVSSALHRCRLSQQYARYRVV